MWISKNICACPFVQPPMLCFQRGFIISSYSFIPPPIFLFSSFHQMNSKDHYPPLPHLVAKGRLHCIFSRVSLVLPPLEFQTIITLFFLSLRGCYALWTSFQKFPSQYKIGYIFLKTTDYSCADLGREAGNTQKPLTFFFQNHLSH